MGDHDELVAAFEAWDRTPHERATAHRLSDAIATAQLDPRRLHDRIAQLRTRPMPPADAVRQAALEQQQPMRRLRCPHCGKPIHTTLLPARCPTCRTEIPQEAA